MKQKKLIIFMPSIEGGGVEKNLFIVSDYKKKKINNVSIISASKKYKKKFNKKINLIFPKSYFWDNLGRRMKYFICLILLFKQIILKKDSLVLCFQANIYCIILCKIFKTKIIVRSNSSPAGWSNNFLKNIIFKIILNKADKILVNSYQFKRQLKHRFNVKSTCIYNPLDKKNIIKNSQLKSCKIFKKVKSLKIINVGRCVDQKDQMTLLKSLKIIKTKIEFEALIVGSGILKNDLINFVKNEKMQKKIKFLDFVKNPYPLIKKADIFILSSKYEGLPNVLLEALTLNKFVISSDCPTGPNEILLKGSGGLLFKTGDHKNLAKRIIYFVKNKRHCKIMLDRAVKELGRFDYNVNLKKYLTSIKEIMQLL